MSDAMKKLKKIFRHPLRWRRSHGFGVHSPFAYDFITKVLCERDAGYYAYSEIAAACRRMQANALSGSAEESEKPAVAQMLFRVFCHFHPSEVIEAGRGNEVTDLIIERAVPGARRSVWHPGMAAESNQETGKLILVNGLGTGECAPLCTFITPLLAAGETVVIIRHRNEMPEAQVLWERLAAGNIPGMGFADEQTAIFVGRKGLPHQIFPVVL